MSITSLIAAFAIVSITTYLLSKVLGLQSTSLLFSREEALRFQERLRGKFGLLAVSANIFGTLTSLATVYVFF